MSSIMGPQPAAKSGMISQILVGGGLVATGITIGTVLQSEVTKDMKTVMALWRETHLTLPYVIGVAAKMTVKYPNGMTQQDVCKEMNLAKEITAILFKALDADNTGKLEAREILAASAILTITDDASAENRRFQFKVLDSDRNGCLSFDEILRLLVIEKILGRLDDNSDPQALAEYVYKCLGKNKGDGISEEEWMKASCSCSGMLAGNFVNPAEKEFDVVNEPVESIARELAIGTLVGICSTTFSHPFDTLKTRMQLGGFGGSGSQSMVSVAMQTVKAEGPLALYKGLYAPVCAAGFKSGMTFFAKALWGRVLTEQMGMQKGSYPMMTLSGALTGLSIAPIIVPTELLKIRMQGSADKNLTTMDCARSIIRNEGVLALTTGTLASSLRLAFSWSIFFSGYDALIKLVTTDGQKPSGLTALGAGSLIGILSWCVSLPWDIVKTKMQMDPKAYPSFMGTIRSIAKADGMIGFYKGFSAVTTRAIVANASFFWFYETIAGVLEEMSIGYTHGLKFRRAVDIQSTALGACQC